MCGQHQKSSALTSFMFSAALAFVLVTLIHSFSVTSKIETYQRMIKDCETAAQSQCEIVAVPSEDLR